MSSSNFRVVPVDSSNREDYILARSEVYLRGNTSADVLPNFDLNIHRFVGYCGDTPAACTNDLPFHFTRGDAVLPAGGVAGVGVRPIFRHKKIGSEMMEWQIRDMRHRGFAVAALYAFREPFYRRFGYELCGHRWQIHCPQERMPKTKMELEPRRVDPEKLEELDACYRTFAHRLSGANIRDAEQWKTRMGQTAPMIFAFGDPVEAYCWTSMDGELFWGDLPFGEVVWTTQRGYESLLAFMRGMVINRTAAVWHEPTGGPFLANYLDQGIKVSLDRPAMYRIVDVPLALSLLRPVEDCEVSIGVVDHVVPENHGPWRVVAREGTVEVSASSSPDLEMDIRQFTQAFMGEPGLPSLLREGQITVRRPEAVAHALRLMPPMPVYCTEFF